jgi:hypothetical protein
VVCHRGATWQALCDTAKEPSDSCAHWVCLCAAGRNGVDGRSLNIRGTYNAGDAYAELDVVTRDETWFIAKKDDPGPCPGPGWKSGPTGKTGRPGPRGEQGLRGLPGEPGRSAREIIAMRSLPNYQIVLVYDDGSETEAFSVRTWFQQYDGER